VQEVDLTDSVNTSPVRTIAGQENIAVSLFNQSPITFDEIVLRDLLAPLQPPTPSFQLPAGTGACDQLLG
jgi:hypothetical protein